MIPCQHQCPHKLMQADSLRCPSCGNGPKRLAISPSVFCSNHSPSCESALSTPETTPRSALQSGAPISFPTTSHLLDRCKSRTGAQKLPASGQAESHSERFPPDRITYIATRYIAKPMDFDLRSHPISSRTFIPFESEFSTNPTKATCQPDILGGSGDGVCGPAGLVLAVTNEPGVEAGGAPLYLRNGKYSELVVRAGRRSAMEIFVISRENSRNGNARMKRRWRKAGLSTALAPPNPKGKLRSR
jgi:hypothetical protein